MFRRNDVMPPAETHCMALEAFYASSWTELTYRGFLRL